MTYQPPVIGKLKTAPVLVVSERASFLDSVAEMLSPDPVHPITIDSAPQTLAGQDAGASCVLLVDADPDAADVLDGIAKLKAACPATSAIVALVPSSASFEFARKLGAAGAREVLPLSLTSDELRDQIARLTAPPEPEVPFPGRGGPPAHLIAVTQARGGIGATTLAVNLACGLVGAPTRLRRNQERKRVALVDLDLQFGNAHVYFDLEDNGGMMRLIESGDVPDAHMVQSIMQSHGSGVDVLNVPARFLPLQSVTPDLISALLTVLKDQYDYVVVDLPRAMVDWIEPVLSDATLLLLATDTSVPCIRQAQRIMNFFREDNVGLAVHVAVNREKRPFIKSEHVREAEKILEKSFSDWLPDNPGAARKAADLGRPVIMAQGKSDLGKAMRKLVEHVRAATLTQQEQDG